MVLKKTFFSYLADLLSVLRIQTGCDGTFYSIYHFYSAPTRGRSLTVQTGNFEILLRERFFE